MDPKILPASEAFRFAEFRQVLSNPEPRVPQSYTRKPMVGCLGSPTALKATHSHVPHVMGLGALGSSAPILAWLCFSRAESASADSAERGG